MAEKESFLDRLKGLGRRFIYEPQTDVHADHLNARIVNQSLFGRDSIHDGVQNTQKSSVEDDLVTRYLDYERMDDYDTTASILDLYADDAAQMNPDTGHVISVKCNNDIIKTHIEHLLYSVQKYDESAWAQARNISKYGNNFEEMVIKKEYGIVDTIFRPSPTMRRIEDYRTKLIGFVRDDLGRFNFSTNEILQWIRGEMHASDINNAIEINHQVYEDYEISHTALKGKNRGSKYGYGVLENSREAFKRLNMMENQHIANKIENGSPKRVFYVDVGSMPADEVEAYMRSIRRKNKRNTFMRSDGSLDLEVNPNSSSDSFYIPTRNGVEKSKVESIEGLEVDLVTSLEYFQNKLHSSSKVPKSFLGYEDMAQKVSLASQDIRFARSVLRIQNALLQGKRKEVDIHLTALGLNIERIEYSLHFVVPSSVFDEIRYEVMRTQLDLADSYKAYTSKRYVMKNFLGFDDSEIEKIIKDRKAEEDAGWFNEEINDKMKRSWLLGEDNGIKEHEKIVTDSIENIIKNNKKMAERIASIKELRDLVRYSNGKQK